MYRLRATGEGVYFLTYFLIFLLSLSQQLQIPAIITAGGFYQRSSCNKSLGITSSTWDWNKYQFSAELG